MRWRPATTHPPRRGKVLVLTGLSLTVLLGMAGMTIDTGLLQTARRQVQNAADAAAVAAAMELYRGNTLENAKPIAVSYIQKNGLADPAVTIAVQVPESGPYKKNTNYVEVIVSAPQTVYFMPILGVSPTQTVAARAVAGFEPITPEGLILLDPTRTPGGGLMAFGNATVTVNSGAIVVNSPGGGQDQYGNPVPGSGYAVDIRRNGNRPGVIAPAVFVHGGVSDPTAFSNSPVGGSNPLQARVPSMVANPLRSLPVPDTWNGADVSLNDPAAVTVTSKTPQTLKPGVYNDITISSNASVTFKPGIYIISPAGSGQGLNIADTATINGAGVMFYLTGSDYLSRDKPPGYYDRLDSSLDGPLPPTNGSPVSGSPPPWESTNPIFSQLTIGGSSGTLTGLNSPGSPFNGMLFYVRPRASVNMDISFAGSGAGSGYDLGGTLYAEWARVYVRDNSRWQYNGPVIIGSLEFRGSSDLTINNTIGRTNYGLTNQVFLVE